VVLQAESFNASESFGSGAVAADEAADLDREGSEGADVADCLSTDVVIEPEGLR
jgi:hypothetical protein